MKILMIGDIFGKPGRKAIKALVPQLVERYGIDLVIANAENLNGGRGMDARRLEELWRAGVQLCTSGNHVWYQREIYSFIDDEARVLRPANFPEPCPGKGYTIIELPGCPPVAVINLLGRVYLPNLDCPFRAIDGILAKFGDWPVIRIIDFHAEATSEKIAFTWHVDGRASLVAGTHTHVQTADERISAKGTAAITDLGMTGPHDSVIGMQKERVLENFLHGRSVTFRPATGDIWFHGVWVEIDESNGRALSIERLRISLEI